MATDETTVLRELNRLRLQASKDHMGWLVEALDGWISKGGFLPEPWAAMQPRQQAAAKTALWRGAVDVLKGALEAIVLKFLELNMAGEAEEARQSLNLAARIVTRAEKEGP